jgi:FKBP-type peptidyl-prolyl cis-trans isomerase 2
LIPGFERAVAGMEPGEKKSVKVPADEAYGPFRNELVQEVERDAFPEGVELRVGQHIEATQPDGGNLRFSIVDLSEEMVTIDGNHPLAGKDLVFDLELVEIS